MTRFAKRFAGFGLCVCLGMLGPAAPIQAQEATPATGGLILPIMGDPALCLVEPRSIDEYIALQDVTYDATPATYAEPEGGGPPDQAAVDAVYRTMLEVSACINAGEFLRLGGLYTDDGFYEETRGVDQETIDFFSQPPAPPFPEGEGYLIWALTNFQALDDDRVGVIFWAQDGGAGGADYMIFAPVGDRYLIDYWVDEYDAIGDPPPAGISFSE